MSVDCSTSNNPIALSNEEATTRKSRKNHHRSTSVFLPGGGAFCAGRETRFFCFESELPGRIILPVFFSSNETTTTKRRLKEIEIEIELEIPTLLVVLVRCS